MDAIGLKTTIRIIAFCCRYCAYAAADLAGVLRLPYPTQTRIVQIPCTGRLDPLEVLHTFEHGADGVMVAGCLEGDCHFQTGNYNAIKRVTYIQSILVRIGLEPERIEMFNRPKPITSRASTTQSTSAPIRCVKNRLTGNLPQGNH